MSCCRQTCGHPSHYLASTLVILCDSNVHPRLFLLFSCHGTLFFWLVIVQKRPALRRIKDEILLNHQTLVPLSAHQGRGSDESSDVSSIVTASMTRFLTPAEDCTFTLACSIHDEATVHAQSGRHTVRNLFRAGEHLCLNKVLTATTDIL